MSILGEERGRILGRREEDFWGGEGEDFGGGISPEGRNHSWERNQASDWGIIAWPILR